MNQNDITLTKAIELIETLLDNTVRDYLQAACAGEYSIAHQYLINQATIMARLKQIKGTAYACKIMSRIYSEALSGNMRPMDENGKI